MAAITGTLPGLPRWVGATAELHSDHVTDGTMHATVTPHIPRVRGALYGAWLHITRKTA